MELIKVTENNGKTAVSARELHAFLEVETPLTKWALRMFEYGFEENVDWTKLSTENQQVDYALTLDCAKHLAMMQRTEKGMAARNYFIECEKQIKSALPQTYKEALLALIAKEEEKEQLALQVDNLSTALDVLIEWVSIIKVAKHNKVSEKLFNWRLLKKTSDEMGFCLKKAESPRYGYQNLYNVNVFKKCYPMYNYNFKN
jgi:anti-repressor protein